MPFISFARAFINNSLHNQFISSQGIISSLHVYPIVGSFFSLNRIFVSVLPKNALFIPFETFTRCRIQFSLHESQIHRRGFDFQILKQPFLITSLKKYGSIYLKFMLKKKLQYKILQKKKRKLSN